LIRREREAMARALAELPEVHAYPSEANMILARVPDAARVFDGMKARGVLVKNVSGLHPLLANCLRITVGTPEENPLTLAALRGALHDLTA
ncbi:MAG TPA: histidinol-phosphate aminotransferase, partial [Burkholderiaceae bacterium]|nr:histidinol-phosphate aminotransferase [Burkholderiaceae bacterium]